MDLTDINRYTNAKNIPSSDQEKVIIIYDVASAPGLSIKEVKQVMEEKDMVLYDSREGRMPAAVYGPATFITNRDLLNMVCGSEGPASVQVMRKCARLQVGELTPVQAHLESSGYGLEYVWKWDREALSKMELKELMKLYMELR